MDVREVYTAVQFAGSYRRWWRGWVEGPGGVARHAQESVYLRPRDGGPPGESVCERLAAATELPLAVMEAAADTIVGGHGGAWLPFPPPPPRGRLVGSAIR